MAIGTCEELVGFYSISTFVGYLMANSVFTYIKTKISKRILSGKHLRQVISHLLAHS